MHLGVIPASLGLYRRAPQEDQPVRSALALDFAGPSWEALILLVAHSALASGGQSKNN